MAFSGIAMSPGFVAVTMFLGLLVGLFLGHPLAFVLGGLATIFGWISSRYHNNFPGLFMNKINGLISNYTYVAVVFFILMANFMSESGMAEGLFKTIQYLFGPVRGGIAIAVILVSTLLAACTGTTGASCVTMGILALPVMKENNYSMKLSCGSIAGSSALGILIPPSIMLLVLSELSGCTVGQLFAGAILPGLTLALMYCVYTLYQCWKYPWKGPALPLEVRKEVTTKQLIKMLLINLLPPLMLIFAVLGVIFGGLATPTEASATGSFCALGLYIAYGKFSWRGLWNILYDTAKTVSMVFIVMMGASLFTAVFMGLGGGKFIEGLILGIGLGKWGTFAVMMLICFFLGMFLDWTAILMITMPIYIPICKAIGFDLLWFTVAMAVMLQDSFCTPPFGYNLFYLKAIAPEGVTTEDIYMGTVPFWAIMELGLVACCACPWLITWLPKVLVKQAAN
ncbi:MAG: TRAP transporter large permease subunit [Spirochaetia bacterium]|nr:TRAP transporter large permease subunit [Spirochaetia bacterium]